MRWLAENSTGRPVAMTMIILVVVVFGLFSFKRLPVNLFPDVETLVVTVLTTYPGAGPEEIENLVTTPIEEAVSGITGVAKVRSVSREGVSVVAVEFEFGADMEYAALQVREKAERARSRLPDDADNPIIHRYDLGSRPTLLLGVSGNADAVSMRKLADDTIKPVLGRISGVAAVEVTGGAREEIRVILDQERLSHFGLTFGDVERALAARNVNVPGGHAESGKSVYVVRTLGEFRSVAQMGDVVVAVSGGSVVRLREVAELERTVEEPEYYTRMDRKASVGVEIRKQSSASAVGISRLVSKAIDGLQRKLPEGTQVRVVFDQGKFAQHSISTVYNQAWQGALLAAVVLYCFLRSLRHTLAIAVSIPVSIIATFFMMYLGKLTLNIMSLGGLAIGVGMMVDNSIVVMENIYRWAEEGHEPWESAVRGTVEVGGAIWGSTITNVAVFLPIVFMKGIVAQFFRELALTVTFSMTASLVSAVTVVPMTCYRMLLISRGKARGVYPSRAARVLEWVRWGTDQGVPGVYRRALAWSLDHRGLVALIAASCVFFTIAIIPFVGGQFMPEWDEGRFTVELEMPAGTPLERTDQVVAQVEEYVSGIEEVEAVFATTGRGRASLADISATHLGSVEVQLVSRTRRSRSTNEIMEWVRHQASRTPGARVRVVKGAFLGITMEAPLQVTIQGSDYTVLEDAATMLAQRLTTIPGTRDVRTSIETRLPEAVVAVDDERAATHGLTTYQVADAIRTALTGQTSTNYRVGGNEIAVRLRLPEPQRKQLDELGNLRIPTSLGTTVMLQDVAGVTLGSGPTAINRENQARAVSVSCSTEGRDLASVMVEAARSMSSIPLPPGYSWEFGGEAEHMRESFDSLGQALVLAILIIYMLLGAQFESLLQPFVVMLTVPLSALGAFWGLLLAGRTVTIVSYVGLIMLVGIVVNNAIVLVEYVNLLRRRDGMSIRNALLKAGPTRLRPILMTSLTTILGVLPLALGLGEGAELEAPLATVVAAGLASSMVLTLIVIPVAYDLFERISDWLTTRIYGGNHSA